MHRVIPMTKTSLCLSTAVLFLAACGPSADVADSETTSSNSLFFNGTIITMEGTGPAYVESVVTDGADIVFVGRLDDARRQYGDGATPVDLQGKTLMPGFIEPHAHPASIGAFILANDIVAPHEWRMPHRTYPGVSGNEAYLAAVEAVVNSKTDKTATVMIWGYHKAWHGELTLDDLDRVTGDVPVIIWQRSTHEVYLNTSAADKYDVTEGSLQESEQVDWENLHFWERGYQEVKGNKLQSFFGDQAMLERGIRHMSSLMLQNGIIAMAEPSFPNTAFDAEYDILKQETDRASAYGLYLIPGFPEQYTLGMSNDDYRARMQSFPDLDTEHIHFLVDQFKLFGDGAIYSLALQLRDGFYNCEDCHGEWIIPPDVAQELFDYWWDAEIRIHIHITGDLAFETYLDFVESAMQRNPRDDHRTTFQHAGLFDAVQAERASELGVEVSANPYYLWALADKYAEVGLGPERAANMVALRELTDRQIPLSLHSDFAMAPAEPLLLAWVAATRTVASGKTANPRQAIPVYDAIKAITIGAAGAVGMDHELGSIAVGKQASFTILEEDPFAVPATALKDIEVLGVVYKGRLIEK